MSTSGWKEPREDERDPEEDGFLRRWVKRKAEARDGGPDSAEPSAAADPPEAVSQEVPEPAPATEIPVPAKASPHDPAERSDDDMPPLDSLNQDSDYSPFLSRGVSPGLRQTALRQLFRQPKFNVETCLDDFQDDFLNFQPLGDIVTSDMRHMAEVEARREAARVARAAEEDSPPEPPDRGQIAEQQTNEAAERDAPSERSGADPAGETISRADPGSGAAGRADSAEASDDQTRMKS